MRRQFFGLRPADIVLILVVFALALGAFAVFWGWGPFAQEEDGALAVVVRAGGEEVLRAPLTGVGPSQQHDVQGPLGTTFVEVAPLSARVVDSPCRDKLCVLHGQISQPGRTIVCLPNRVSVELVSLGEQPFDALSR